MTLPALTGRARRGDRLVMITAYDAPSARLADEAGVDVILVGDSAGTTTLGGTSTVPVTLDEMVMFTRGVTRGAVRPFIVADMPFGSYQVSDERAVASAVRLIKEGGADAVKLEGAGAMTSRVRAIVGAGIPVMGHIGLTPQSATMLGGYKAQGRTPEAAVRLVEEARSLEEAGCFSVVVEAVPAVVASDVRKAIAVPTFGIGAGPDCAGQVLVWHDVLGLLPNRPARFVKQYANLSAIIAEALEAYVQDVRTGAFPEDKHTYKMDK